ncbi:MAG: hypothetical protein ABEJ94_06440 [Halorientalis sp.]
MSDRTTIALTDDQKNRLDDAATAIFETESVPYHVVIGRLLDDHDEVPDGS